MAIKTLVKPYIAMSLKGFPAESYQEGNAEIHPMWSGEGNLSYLVVNSENREGFLIDPDLEILGSYLLTLDRQQIKLVAIIDTHTHAEHASAGPTLQKLLNVPYIMNQKAPSGFVTDRVGDGDEQAIAGIQIKFHETPGHTQDLMTVQIGGRLFTGDSLFIKGSGRTDLPGGDAGMQFDSLQRLMQFPDNFITHPGHDYNGLLTATIGDIRRDNKRLQIRNRDEFIDFMADYYANEEKPDDLEYYVAYNAR